MKIAIPAVVVAVTALVLLPLVGARENPETAVVEFPGWVKLADVFLKGTYLVVHDNDRMARGEPCFAVYGTKRRELIASFHCAPVERRRVDKFTAVTVESGSVIKTIVEIQFPGSPVGHRIR